MPAYDLLIALPEPCTLIVSAHSDDEAESLVRESLAYDYAGVTDPAVLAARVDLTRRVGGAVVFRSTVAKW